MSKFMKAVEGYEASFDESIIEEQDRELKALMFESLVLTESLEIYPVYEGEFFDRVKKVASDIWDKIIEFFDTVANTIGKWISQLKGLFNKRKSEEAKAKNTSNENKEEKEEIKSEAEGEKKYLQKITITIEKGHINVLDGHTDIGLFIDSIIKYIEVIHKSAEDMYREPEKVTDKDIEELSNRSKGNTIKFNESIARIAQDASVEITMENAETYINKLQKFKGEIEQANSKIRAMKNMSKDSYSKAAKKGKDAEVIANKISGIVSHVANWLPRMLKDFTSTINKCIQQLRTFLIPKSE